MTTLQIHVHVTTFLYFSTKTKDSVFSNDILISGSAARNHTVHGDRVVVEVLPRSQWISRSSSLTQSSQGRIIWMCVHMTVISCEWLHVHVFGCTRISLIISLGKFYFKQQNLCIYKESYLADFRWTKGSIQWEFKRNAYWQSGWRFTEKLARLCCVFLKGWGSTTQAREGARVTLGSAHPKNPNKYRTGWQPQRP